MRKKTRLLVGIFVLIIVGVVGYYQFALSRFRGIEQIICYQVKKGVTILPGDAIAVSVNVVPIMANKNDIPTDYINSQPDLKDKVANTVMYPGDIITAKKIVTNTEYFKDEERYVSLNSKDIDSFAGNDVRPGDIIDILIFDPSTMHYIVKDEYKNIQVLDVKNQDGIRYIEYKGNEFKVQSIYFKMTNALYSKLMTEINNNDSKFTVSIHGNRPTVLREKSNTNSTTTTLNLLK